MKNKHKLHRKISYTLRYIALLAVSLFILAPFIWMLSTSFKKFSQVFQYPPQWWPDPFQWSNYIELFQKYPFHLYMFNSIYIGVLVTVGACLFAALAGYAFAKIHFPMKNIIFIFLLSSMMIPTEATAIPLYSWMSRIGWVDTHLPLIFPPMLGAQGMFGVFLLRQFYITVPDEMVDASKIDGCSPWKTFWRIMVPMSTPVLATLSIFVFLTRWDEFFEPLVYLSSSDLYTIPLALSLFTTEMGTPWHLVMAASVVSTIPVLVVVYFAQKKLAEGISLTGMK